MSRNEEDKILERLALTHEYFELGLNSLLVVTKI